MAEQQRKICPDCSKPFSSRAHMIRHQKSTHSKQRLFNCKWCFKAFYRSDTLRDHIVRCGQRDRREPFTACPPENPGRKRHACNMCKIRKVSCTGEIPCARCVSSGLQCAREATRVSYNKPPTMNGSDDKLSSLERNSISVLLNRFDTRSEFVAAFPESDPSNQNLQQRPPPFDLPPSQMTSNVVMEAQPVALNSDYLSFLDFNNENVDFGSCFENIAWSLPIGPDPGQNDNVPELWEVLDTVKLERRVFQLNSQLHESLLQLKTANGSIETSALLKALSHFNLKSVRENFTLYFEHWHKHAPIVHKATVDIAHCATPLLMGIYCVGGQYAKAEENVQMKLLFDLIEYFCYDSDSDAIQWDPTPLEDFNFQKKNLETVQGLYLLVVAQYFSGEPQSRRRAANLRFGSTATVMVILRRLARRLKFTLAHHKSNTGIYDRHDYEKWILTESSIRTMNMLLLLDRGLSIFSNIPTRFEHSELDLQLPCPEPVFNSSSVEAVAHYLQHATPKTRVVEAFRLLFLTPEGENLPAVVMKRECLDPWDMQILIHSLYGFVWHQLYSNPILQILSSSKSSIMSAVKTALANWMLWWTELKISMPKCEWAKYGFHGYSDLYWAMVKGLIHCAENARDTTHRPIAADCTSVGAHLRLILDSVAS